MRRFLVKVATKLGLYGFIVKVANKIIDAREARAISKRGVDVLVKVDKLMRARNAKAFFNYGLLLGAYREKNFIPYDHDIDFGMLASERPDDMVEYLKQNGFEFIRQMYIKDNGYITIDQFKCDGVHVDFYYLYDYNEDRLVCYAPRRHEYKDWRTANETDGFPTFLFTSKKCGFSEKEFLGHKFYMPDETESWLQDFYGEDFMTPIKDWSPKSETVRKTGIIPYTHCRQYRRVDL
ncbi:MAG: LicD family protein [Bacteroidales bacterium]|nr:LicD family protein [Bacteroidales bacterium]